MTIYLYEPHINKLTETDYKSLSGMTGRSITSLMSAKSRKSFIRSVNAYIVDGTITLEQRRQWYEKVQYPDEAWKEIKGSDGKYFVSSYGRFKVLRKNGREKILLPYIHKRTGYMKVKVMYKGVKKEYKVGNLVAEHFLPAKGVDEVLIHKNGIKTDDSAANLAYMSRTKRAKKTGPMSRSKAVVQLDIKTREVIGEFRSAREAGRKCFLSYQAVMDNCNHKSKTSGGYIFMWEEEYEQLCS